MGSFSETQLLFSSLRLPFTEETKYAILAFSVTLFTIAMVILAWQIYRYCKGGPRRTSTAKVFMNVDSKPASGLYFETADKRGSDARDGDYKVQKLQDEIEKLSRCLSPAPSSGDQDSIDLDIATDAETEADGEVLAAQKSKLRGSLQYDHQEAQLTIAVLEAHELPGHCTEPFVRVKLLSGPDDQQPNIVRVAQQWETRLVKNSQNPLFGERFCCHIMEKELRKSMVKFEVRDFDRYSRHSILGEVRLSLDSLNVFDPVEFVEVLQKSKKDAVGETLLSLKFLPTSQRLEIGLLKIKMAPRDTDSKKALFARVSVVYNQTKLKHQKSPLKLKEDVTVFNEVLTFTLPDPYIRECIIGVSVYEICFDKKKNKHLIGQVIFGKRASSEDDHWQLMMQSLRQPVARWHPLLI
ncbi:synaptotagmin-2 [Polypterus senegalus]|uniref:synaptotagmin-2 n=1 Tax=Polypterus senegalus TaxID=55291 RepID=UPI0019642BF9|nr:synaptotagmin-2 [Polypterus senegalus]